MWTWCIQHEGTCAKAPIAAHCCHCSLGSTTHADFAKALIWLWSWTNHQTVTNVLVFCDHLVKAHHSLHDPWPNCEVLLLNFYGRDTSQYLEIQPSSWAIKAPIVRVTSVKGCMSSSWAYRRLGLHSYHAQTNMDNLMQAHQMPMHMIGKLSKDWKADRPRHLPELVPAYYSTRSAITRYSPHYLMFRCQTTLYPFTSTSLSILGIEKCWHVSTNYIAELCEWLWEAFKEVQDTRAVHC